MTKDEVVQEVCAILALAYHSIGDFSYACDGICSRCRAQHGPDWNYSNGGQIVDYVREAVLQRLKRDGIAIDDGFDPETGREKDRMEREELKRASRRDDLVREESERLRLEERMREDEREKEMEKMRLDSILRQSMREGKR
jgi:hypothetical protein